MRKKKIASSHGERIGNAMANINRQIELFVKQIVEESHKKAEDISYRIQIEKEIYQLLIFNKKTGQVAGKAWPLNNFLNLCSKRRIEFELNKVVRQLLLKTEEKYKEKIYWI